MFGQFKRLFKNIAQLDELALCVTVYRQEEIQQIILSYNRIDQLTEGMDSEGNIIGVYSPATDIISEGRSFVFQGRSYEKIAGEPYNFVDTAHFLESFSIVIHGDGFVIQADDDKGEETLTGKFGKNILGLTDENKAKLSQAMLPFFIEAVREAMLKEVL